MFPLGATSAVVSQSERKAYSAMGGNGLPPSGTSPTICRIARTLPHPAGGPGGLRAHYRHKRGTDREWTVLGASRGEAGILGEGIRQALLRDPTYRPALNAANALLHA